MKLDISALDKKTGAGTLDVADSIFATEFKEALIHQVLTAYLATGRSGTKASRSRSEVAGGGRKPWRQKGTGRARAGTIRSPIWRGGGVTFAAKTRSYEQKINKKMYRGAMCSILSELLRQERLICVDNFTVAEPKTAKVKEKLAKLNLKEVLIVTAELDENLYLGARNIPHVDVIDCSEINPYSLIGFDKVVMTKQAIEKVGEVFA